MAAEKSIKKPIDKPKPAQRKPPKPKPLHPIAAARLTNRRRTG